MWEGGVNLIEVTPLTIAADFAYAITLKSSKRVSDETQTSVDSLPILGMTLATIVSNWIAIGAIGAIGDGLLFDTDEWLAFVKFVNEINEEVRYAK